MCCCFLFLCSLIYRNPSSQNPSYVNPNIAGANDSKIVSQPINQKNVTQKIYNVVKIVDGDTFDINDGGAIVRIRMIGIDTPETAKSSQSAECMALESSLRLAELIENKKVALEFDSTQGDEDKYDRKLRFVFLEDGTNVNKLLIEEGYAKEYTYSKAYKYQKEFKDAQENAEYNKLGIWGEKCACKVSESKSCTSCNVATITKTDWSCSQTQENIEDSSCSNLCPVVNENTYTPPTYYEPEPVYQPPAQSCLYSCSGPDRDCSDFSTHYEAQTFFNCCGFSPGNDPMRLDKANGVGNGLACESLP